MRTAGTGCARAAQFPEKLIVLRSKKDIRRWMRGLEH